MTWSVHERTLNSGSWLMHWVAFLCMSLIIRDVKKAARIGDTQDPWGMPVSTGWSSSLFPSRLGAVFLSSRKDFTHQMMGSGMQYFCSVSIRYVKSGTQPVS